MRANMISAEIVHRIKRTEIDPLRDFLPGFNFQGRLRVTCRIWRNLLTFASSHLKSKPRLTISVMKIDIAPGKICDANHCHDRLVRNVLQPLEFSFHLNLRLCFNRKEQKTRKGQWALKHSVE